MRYRRQTFLQLDFRDREDVTSVLQYAERGERRCAGRGGGRLPPPSHSVALADPMGWSGKKLQPGTVETQFGVRSFVADYSQFPASKSASGR